MTVKTKNISKSIKEFAGTLITTCLIVFITIAFVAQSLEISGTSMVPSFQSGERTIVEKVTYKTQRPERYDVVVVRSPQNPSLLLIKRVIGLPYEHIKILSDGKVYANDTLLDQNFINLKEQAQNTYFKYNDYDLKKDEFFVMGDNRNHSNDSRFFGAIHKDDIVGRAFLVYWPLNKIRLVQH